MLALTQNFVQAAEALLPDLMWDEALADGPDPLLDAFPLEYEDSNAVKWDMYEDPYGLLSLRAVDTAPDMITLPGNRVYTATPGYYGNVTQLRESELVMERQPGTVNDPIDVRDRLGKMMLYFAPMAVNRIRQTLADLVRQGYFLNTSAAGIKHGYTVDNYRTLSPGTGWAANPSTATPINDLKGWQNTLQFGTSSRFGSESCLLCPDSVVNDLLATTQIQSVYKDRFGATFLAPGSGNNTSGIPLEGDQGLNKLLVGMGLPSIVPYNHGYYTTLADAQTRNTNNFNKVIPPKTLLWVGKRPKNQKIGAFKLTRHAGLLTQADANKYPTVSVGNDPSGWANGLYVRAKYHDETPIHYRVEIGFNACPVMFYGSATAGISYS